MEQLPLWRATSRRVGFWVLLIFPKRLLTTAIGRVLRSRPSRLAIPLFARYYKIAMEEAELPWRQYASLTEFFARRLRQEARPMIAQGEEIVAPCDGVVMEMGTITADRALQVKGVDYSIAELLAYSNASFFEGGTYVTIYLSPKDYHHVHAPIDAILLRCIHVPGALFPVNRLGAACVARLFARNERTVSWLSYHDHSFALVKVGSVIVGSVQLAKRFKSMVKTRQNGPVVSLTQDSLRVARGDDLAWFEFGSTVIMVFAKGQVALSLAKGDRVRALQTIGRFSP